MADRRGFLKLLGGIAAAAIAVPYVPEKLYFVGGWPGAHTVGALASPTIAEIEAANAALTTMTVQATLQQYGAWLRVTDAMAADPLSQVGVAGWKAKYLEVICEPSRIGPRALDGLSGMARTYFDPELLRRMAPQHTTRRWASLEGLERSNA